MLKVEHKISLKKEDIKSDEGMEGKKEGKVMAELKCDRFGLL